MDRESGARAPKNFSGKLVALLRPAPFIFNARFESAIRPPPPPWPAKLGGRFAAERRTCIPLRVHAATVRPGSV